MTLPIKNSIIGFPDVVSAHIFGFLSTHELCIFGRGQPQKSYKNIRTATFMRAVHSTIQERPTFKALKECWKEYRSLEGIVAKLCSKQGCCPASNEFLVYIADTNSFENFNKSIRWLRDGEDADEHWIRSIVPGSNWNGCVWTDDERQLVDRWLFEYDEYYKYDFDDVDDYYDY